MKTLVDIKKIEELLGTQVRKKAWLPYIKILYDKVIRLVL
jgi:hypothetical protein